MPEQQAASGRQNYREKCMAHRTMCVRVCVCVDYTLSSKCQCTKKCQATSCVRLENQKNHFGAKEPARSLASSFFQFQFALPCLYTRPSVADWKHISDAAKNVCPRQQNMEKLLMRLCTDTTCGWRDAHTHTHAPNPNKNHIVRSD